MVSGNDPNSGDLIPPGSARGNRPRMLGARRENPDAPPRPAARPATAAAPHRISGNSASRKSRVLFVCIGNSCRSQVAQAFARAYGTDVIESESAGVSPATMVAPQTKQVLAEWNLQIDDQFPKGLEIIRHQPFDLIVNMSGIPLAPVGMRVVNWAVPDPMGQRDAIHRSVAVQLEGMVMQLILELRTAAKSK